MVSFFRRKYSFRSFLLLRYKIKKQKWPAKVGHCKSGDGPWFEVWNDGSYRPTLWTKIKFLLSKAYQNKYKR